MFPLFWSIAATILLGWALFSLEGKDIMAAPLFFLVWLIAVPGSWAVYGLYHLVAWLF